MKHCVATEMPQPKNHVSRHKGTCLFDMDHRENHILIFMFDSLENMKMTAPTKIVTFITVTISVKNN